MILNIYPYGSRVYKTADEQSDTDLIVVSDSDDRLVETQLIWPGIDLTIWTAATYQQLLDDHDPSALECWHLPDDMAIRSRDFRFHLDLGKLRQSFSAKSSNSWVKAKKKIKVHGEWRLGLKSLFHSLRILGFGIQIAKTGRIADYTCANHYWHDIMIQYYGTLDAGKEPCWQDFKDYWQPHYNRLHSEFRLAAPLAEGENR